MFARLERGIEQAQREALERRPVGRSRHLHPVDVPETVQDGGWPAAYAGTLILAVAALAITLLWLRADQRTAALVAVTLFGLWSVYFPVQELLAPRLYLAASL